MADLRDRLTREDAAETRRMRREARSTLAKAARTMRRRVTVPTTTTEPMPEIMEPAGVILEPAGLFLSRTEIERVAAELAADYCGADPTKEIR
jgi:hypothetical protein